MPSVFTLSFLRKEQRSKHAYTFYFQRKEGFDFLPGQYIRMTLPNDNADERGTSRFFTIASSPTEHEYAMVTTEEGPSTFKTTLFSLQAGQEVQFFGPNGRFIFDEADTRPHIFLAGGIGITPFRSMIRYAYDKKITTQMTLFVSWKTPEDMVYDPELTQITGEGNWFHYIPTMTRMEEYQGQWNGEVGRISKDMVTKYAPDFLKAVFLITGPPPMVEAMEQMVKEMGVPEEQIQTEKFTGY